MFHNFKIPTDMKLYSMLNHEELEGPAENENKLEVKIKETTQITEIKNDQGEVGDSNKENNDIKKGKIG